MRFFRIIMAGLLISTVLAFTVSSTVSAFELFPSKTCNHTSISNTKSPICDSANQAVNNDNKNPAVRLLHQTADLFALISGIAAIIMIVVSGFTLITSAGNSEAITNSRRRIVAALAGLVVIALSWTIIRLVIDKVVK